MSEVQEGIVRKVFVSEKGGCSIYLEGGDGALYCNNPYKAEQFPVGSVVEFVVKKPVGKGYAIDKIRIKPEQPAIAKEARPADPVSAPITPPVAPTHAVRSSVSADAERQRMIIVQSCQKVAVDMLKIYMEKEAFTLGAAVNKRKAVIDAFFNGLVYDLVRQVENGPVALEGKPEDAKPVTKPKREAAAKPSETAPDDERELFADLDDLP